MKKSGIGSYFRVIRCRFIFSGKNDELTPDFFIFSGKNDELTPDFFLPGCWVETLTWIAPCKSPAE